MDSEKRPLESIVYISLPEELNHQIGDFTVDPSILIPVEAIPGQKDWDMNDLSWEMIIAAMLKILVYDKNHKNAEYYKNFILAAKPDIVHELSKSAIEKAKRKDYEIAEEIFKGLVSLNPEDINSHLNLALVYEEHSETYEKADRVKFAEIYRELAFETYKNAMVLDPDNEHVHFNSGHFYLKQKNTTKAIQHFKRYLELSRNGRKKEIVEGILKEFTSQENMDHLFKEAYDFIRLGKEREGIDKISLFLDKYPEVWNAWFLLGWAFRRLANYEKGKQAFEKALELGPAQSDTLNELAICLMELRDFQKCRRTLEQALRLEPENVKIISNLGILSLKEERLSEAEGYFKSVLEIEPKDPIALNYLNYLHEGNNPMDAE